MTWFARISSLDLHSLVTISCKTSFSFPEHTRPRGYTTFSASSEAAVQAAQKEADALMKPYVDKTALAEVK